MIYQRLEIKKESVSLVVVLMKASSEKCIKEFGMIR